MPKLPKFLSSLLIATKRNMGFTMIELLIVISILGFLAVAVLAAINPIEQINRGKDTSSRSDVEQLISAVDRYYTFNGFYPWQQAAGDGADALPWTNFSLGTLKDAGATCLVSDKLSQTTTAGCTGSDELKVTFLKRITVTTYNPLYIYNRGTQGDSTYVCFKPQSKAFLDEATKRCGTAGAGLPSDIDGTTKTTICGGTATTTFTCLP